MKAFSGLKKMLGLGANEEVSTAQVRTTLGKLPGKGLGKLGPAEEGFENRDQRYRRLEKITPPYPLPYVSRASLRRIANPLARPHKCPFCEGEVALDSNDVIYRGKRYGDWPYVYHCAGECDAYVGLHPNTDVPLGTLADRTTRDARKEAKDLFFKWQDMADLRKNSTQAYIILAEAMGIEVAVCHFAMFDADACNRAIAHLANLMAEQLEKLKEAGVPWDDDILF